MRVHSGTWRMLAVLTAIIALDSPLLGAEPKSKDEAADDAAAPALTDDDSPKKKERPVGAKDPVTVAFALPKGVVLNSAQQAAYDDLKQKYEPQLRQAFDDVQQSGDGATRSRALKEVKESKAKINAGIQDILSMPYQAAAEKTGQSGGGSYGGSSSGAYYPAGYYPAGNYPWGYYAGGYYPGGYYPYHHHKPYGTSSGTKKTSTGQGGSTNNVSKPQSTTTPAPKPPPKPPAPKKH